MTFRLRQLLILLLFSATQPLLASINLEVIDVSPLPTYKKNLKGNELFKFLTDGSVTKKSMWARSGSLTWKQPVPVQMEITLNPRLNNDVDSLDFHFGEKEKSGVFLPNRIDIYQKSDEGDRFVHVGFWQKKRNSYIEKSQWINVPVTLINLKSSIFSVIHAGGKIMSLDEVDVSFKKSSLEKHEGTIFDLDNIIEHSFGMLIKNNKNTKNEDIKSGGFSIDTFDPFVGFLNFSREKTSNILYVEDNSIINMGIKLYGIEENACFIVDIPDYVKLYKIESIYSVYGNEIPDALIPLNSCVDLIVGKSTYLFIQFEVSDVEPDQDFIPIKFVSRDLKPKNKELFIRFVRKQKNNKKMDSCLAVNPWTYSNETPFWDQPEEMHRFLVSSGVNVFYLASSQFPSVKDIGSRKSLNRSMNQLKKHLSLYNEARHIILFGLLDRKVDWDQPKYKVKREIKNWFKLLNSEVEKFGFSENQVLLYPLDEVRGENWERLMTIIDAIDGVDSNIGIYVNPIFKKKDIYNPKIRKILSKLKKSVYVWQPRFETVGLVDTDIYLGEDAQLWYYQNPDFPARQASPMFYKSLAIKAVENGYSGVGFWSVTDTKGSSSWSDIDGKRPDWTSLYYKDGRIISSLRWEAFRAGLNEACEII